MTGWPAAASARTCGQSARCAIAPPVGPSVNARSITQFPQLNCENCDLFVCEIHECKIHECQAKSVNLLEYLQLWRELRRPPVRFAAGGYLPGGCLHQAHQDPVCGDEEGRPGWVDDEPAGRPMIEAIGVSSHKLRRFERSLFKALNSALRLTEVPNSGISACK